MLRGYQSWRAEETVKRLLIALRAIPAPIRKASLDLGGEGRRFSGFTSSLPSRLRGSQGARIVSVFAYKLIATPTFASG
jgi:hypothetical protein